MVRGDGGGAGPPPRRAWLTAAGRTRDARNLPCPDAGRGYTSGVPHRTLGADGTPPAARRQRAHLPRVLRPHRPAPDHLEGRARHRRLRLHEHRAARDPGREARPRRGRLRPPKPTFRHDRYAEYKAHPDADAGRHAGPDPEGPRGRERRSGSRSTSRRGSRRTTRSPRSRARPRPRASTSSSSPATWTCSSSSRSGRRLMVSLRGGIANTVSYDLAKIEDRWGLRPDQMLDYKALKGDSTDNIPGIPGVGEKTASKLVATWGTLDELYVHLDEVTPEKLRAPLTRAPRPGARESRELMRLVRAVDLQFDPSRGAGGGLRPRGGRPPVPRVRVPDAHRPPAAARRRATRGRDRGDARAARRRVPGGAGRGSWGGGAGRPERRWRPWRGTAGRVRRGRPSSSSRSTSTSVSGRRRRPAAPARAGGRRWRDRIRRGASGLRRRRWRATCRRALAAAIDDPSRIEVVGADGVAALEPWLRAQPPWAPASSWTTRGRSPGRRSRSPSPGRTDESSRPMARTRRSRCASCSRSSSPARRARRQAAPHRALRGGPRTRPARRRVRHPDRRVPRQRRAAGPEDRRRRRGAPRPRAAADGRRLPPAAVAGPRGAVVARGPPVARAVAQGATGVDRLFAEIELPLIPILARMEAAGIALDLEALRHARPRVRRRDHPARARDLRRRRPRVHDRQPQAAGRDPVRRDRPAEGPQDEDGVLDRRVRARGAARRPPGHRARSSTGGSSRSSRSTYVEALPTLLGPDGRLHTLFHQAVAATGRLSIVRPEPPEHPDPDAARPPDPPRVRRGLAGHDARRRRLQPDRAPDPRPRDGDEHLRDAFAREADIHRETAARVLRKPPEDVTARRAVDGQDGQLRARLRDERLRARRAGPASAARTPQEFVNCYFAAYGGISRYMLHIRETAGEPGYVSTLLGRKRQIPELRPRTARSRPPASGWRSTCRSRARPPTS